MATVNKDFKIKHGLIVEGNTGTINGNNILTDANTTDVLDEGTTNLYYTDSRVKNVLTGSTQTNISITEVDGDLVITAENGVAGSTTDDLDEGTTNLYFTDQRAQDAVTNNLTTDDLDEGTINLYYTDQRVSDVIAASTTDDLDEGTTNLYYTDARARLAISGGNGITYDDETGEIVVDTTVIADKQYVDAATAGLNVHDSVKAATIENINLTTDLENGDLLDGVTLATGNRILVKDQTTKTQNGVYIVQASGAAVRATDYNEAGEVDAGDFIFVEGGTVNGKTGWVQTNTITTIGSDNIEFTQFSGAGTYVGGTGITVDGTSIELDFTEFDTDDIDEGATNLYYTTDRAKTDAANLLTGATLNNITITGDETGLTITAENGVDDSTTDDLDEGTTNLYFTDQRVKDVLTGSAQTNISITEVDGDLVITAENGVADSTTDDLDEGTTNLYFTDQRAVDALEAIVPSFTAVEVNSVAKNIAATALLATAEVAGTVYSFAHAEYRTAKFLVKMAAGSHTEVVEVLLTLDSSNNIAITQYAIVGTNGELGVIDAALGGTGNADVLLRVEPNNNSTTVNVYGTLLV